MRALLLVNPGSRRGASIDMEAIRARLQVGGITPVEPEQPDRPPAESIQAQGASVDAVILGGGDGTLNGAAEALIESKRPLGILPLGTGNDLARTLHLPDDPLEAVDVVVAGRRRWIDLGRANEKLFFNVASAGISVEIAQQLSGEVKKRWGKLGYPITTWKVLRRHRPFRLTVACDGREVRLKAIQVTVGNGRFYGGGMTVHEDAAIDDGQLDLYALRAQPWWKLMLRALHLRRGLHDDPRSVITVTGREITLTTLPDQPVNTDGEVTTETPLTVRLVPQALEVFVPADT